RYARAADRLTRGSNNTGCSGGARRDPPTGGLLYTCKQSIVVAEIVFTPSETKVLTDLFGRTVNGATKALAQLQQGSAIPEGVTADLLTRYLEVAKAALANV